MTRGFGILLSTFLTAIAQAQDHSNSWRLDHGIGSDARVWSREVPHPPYREFRGEVSVEGKVAEFIALLLDTPNIPSWVTYATSAEVVRFQPPNRHMVKTVFSPPWPLRPRELISVSRYWRDTHSETVYLLAEARPNAEPPLADVIRIRHSAACWQIRSNAHGQLRIRYQGFTDAGGILPYWVTNPYAGEALHGTLTAISGAIGNVKNKRPIIPNHVSGELSYCQNLQQWE